MRGRGVNRTRYAVPHRRAGAGGVRGAWVVFWGVGATCGAPLHALFKMSLMLKRLYRFKPPDLAPKRALLGAMTTDFKKIGHGGGLWCKADPVVPSGTSIRHL